MGDEIIAEAVAEQGRMRLQFLEDGGAIEGKTREELTETAMRGWSTWENKVVREMYRGRHSVTPAEMKIRLEQIRSVDAGKLAVVPITGHTVRADWPPYIVQTAAGAVADPRLKNQILVQSIGMTTSAVQFFRNGVFSFWVPENCEWEQWEAIVQMARNVGIVSSDAHFAYKHPILGQAVMAKPRDLSAMLETTRTLADGRKIVQMAVVRGEELRRATAMLKRRYDHMRTASVGTLRRWFKNDIEKLPRAVSVVRAPDGVWRTHEFQFVLVHDRLYASHIKVIQNLCQGKIAIFEAFEQPQGGDQAGRNEYGAPRSVIVDDQESFEEALSMVKNGILHVRKAPEHAVISKYVEAGLEGKLQKFFDESQPAGTREALVAAETQLIGELSEQEDEQVESGDEERTRRAKEARNRVRERQREETAGAAEDKILREEKERTARTKEEQRAKMKKAAAVGGNAMAPPHSPAHDNGMLGGRLNDKGMSWAAGRMAADAQTQEDYASAVALQATDEPTFAEPEARPSFVDLTMDTVRLPPPPLHHQDHEPMAL